PVKPWRSSHPSGVDGAPAAIDYVFVDQRRIPRAGLDAPQELFGDEMVEHEVNAFDDADVVGRNLDAMIDDVLQAAARKTGPSDRRRAVLPCELHGAQNVRRIAAGADADDRIARV